MGEWMDQCKQRSAGAGIGERVEQVGCSARATRLGPVCTVGGGGGRCSGEALTRGADGESGGGHEQGGGVGVVEGAELLELTVEAAVLLG